MITYLDQPPLILLLVYWSVSATHTHLTTLKHLPPGNQKDGQANVGKRGGEVHHFATAFHTIKDLTRFFLAGSAAINKPFTVYPEISMAKSWSFKSSDTGEWLGMGILSFYVIGILS